MHKAIRSISRILRIAAIEAPIAVVSVVLAAVMIAFNIAVADGIAIVAMLAYLRASKSL